MLTERQIALLEHLQANCGRFLTQYEIAMALPQWYPVDAFMLDREFHDSRARLQLTFDIRAINASADVQQIIISSNKGVKLASAEEFEKYIAKQYAAVFRRLNRIRIKERKGRLDGQLALTGTGDTVTVSAFADYKTRRKNAGLKAADVVDYMQRIDSRFDAPLLSKIENGICLPNAVQAEALKILYDNGRN